MITAAEHPELVDALALICPGLLPRVGVSLGEKLRIAWAMLTNRRKTFPIPLSDPALFTANPEGQAFIAADPLGLRAGDRRAAGRQLLHRPQSPARPREGPSARCS